MHAAWRRQGNGAVSARRCGRAAHPEPRLAAEPEGGNEKPRHPVEPTERARQQTFAENLGNSAEQRPPARTPSRARTSGAGRARTPRRAGALTPIFARARPPRKKPRAPPVGGRRGRSSSSRMLRCHERARQGTVGPSLQLCLYETRVVNS